MKRILSYILITFFFQHLVFSQFDLKGGVELSLPFGMAVGAEYLHQENLGFELGVVTNTGMLIGEKYKLGTSILLNCRYYFNPRYGNDRFSIGPYLRPFTEIEKLSSLGGIFIFQNRTTGLGFGVLIGRKIVNKKFSFLETNIGLGRSILQTVSTSEVSRYGSWKLNIDLFLSIKCGFRIH